MTPAHPRSRGENLASRRRRVTRCGSSPLTRGKHAGRLIVGCPVRLIPAHAGKTPTRVALASRARAHPRSRGENHSVLPRLPSADGSSPLTRGKPVKYADLVGMLRLIPAHAGKTQFIGASVTANGAHPRSRGENGGCYAIDSN